MSCGHIARMLAVGPLLLAFVCVSCGDSDYMRTAPIAPALAAAVARADRVEIYEMSSVPNQGRVYDFTGPGFRKNKHAAAGPDVEFFRAEAPRNFFAKPLGVLAPKTRKAVDSILLDLDSYSTERYLLAPTERYFLRYCCPEGNDVLVFLDESLTYTYICDAHKNTVEVSTYTKKAQREWGKVRDTF